MIRDVPFAIKQPHECVIDARCLFVVIADAKAGKKLHHTKPYPAESGSELS